MMGVLLNATCPCNNTADLMLETKMKPVPPSLSNYVQRQTYQEHSVCVCGVACEWQHPPPSNCSRHFRHLCVTLQEWPMLLTNDIKRNKSYVRGTECLSGAALPVGTVSSWHFHSLQGSGRCAYPAWGGSSLQLGTFKHPPGVLLHLQCDQPMSIRSNWNNYVK